jgi:hypothetical protein
MERAPMPLDRTDLKKLKEAFAALEQSRKRVDAIYERDWHAHEGADTDEGEQPEEDISTATEA